MRADKNLLSHVIARQGDVGSFFTEIGTGWKKNLAEIQNIDFHECPFSYSCE